jgi:hypothetical protein
MNVKLILKVRNDEDSASSIGLPLKLAQGRGDSAVLVGPLNNDG